jgi:hypothetical protein
MVIQVIEMTGLMGVFEDLDDFVDSDEGRELVKLGRSSALHLTNVVEDVIVSLTSKVFRIFPELKRETSLYQRRNLI